MTQQEEKKTIEQLINIVAPWQAEINCQREMAEEIFDWYKEKLETIRRKAIEASDIKDVEHQWPMVGLHDLEAIIDEELEK